jgi:hypothetical protein
MFQSARLHNCRISSLRRERGAACSSNFKTPAHALVPQKTHRKPPQAHGLEPTGSRKLLTSLRRHGGCFSPFAKPASHDAFGTTAATAMFTRWPTWWPRSEPSCRGRTCCARGLIAAAVIEARADMKARRDLQKDIPLVTADRRNVRECLEGRISGLNAGTAECAMATLSNTARHNAEVIESTRTRSRDPCWRGG